MNIDTLYPIRKTVVIYARVSTEHEAQLSALDNQLEWYKPLLSQHPEWTLIRSYVDAFTTNRIQQKKRPALENAVNTSVFKSSGECMLVDATVEDRT